MTRPTLVRPMLFWLQSNSVDAITSAEQAQAVADYKHAASLKSDLAWTDLAKEKPVSGQGAYAINPVNGKEIPTWIVDYVLCKLRNRGYHGRSSMTSATGVC